MYSPFRAKTSVNRKRYKQKNFAKVVDELWNQLNNPQKVSRNVLNEQSVKTYSTAEHGKDMMSNFQFLPAPFATIAEAATKAESHIHGDPRAACFRPLCAICCN